MDLLNSTTRSQQYIFKKGSDASMMVGMTAPSPMYLRPRGFAPRLKKLDPPVIKETSPGKKDVKVVMMGHEKKPKTPEEPEAIPDHL